MKIIQINVVYKRGSTGNLVYSLHDQLTKKGYESIVLYGRGNCISEDNIFKIGPELLMKFQSLESRLTGFAYAGCEISTELLTKSILRIKPDIVHLHCLNGYFVNIYRLLNFLKDKKIPTVITLHAEFMFTAGCSYSIDCQKWITGCGNCPQFNKERPRSWFFDRSLVEWEMMKNAYQDYDLLTIVPVSKWLYKRAIKSPFFADKKIKVVLNGVDTKEVFKPQDYCTLVKKHNLGDEKIILYVTPNFNSPIKGGKYVIQLAKRLIDYNIKFIIVGFNGDRKSLPKNVTPVEHLDNQIEIARYYSLADLTLLTSERETFSMVCAESLSCGTPVVGFEAGAPETIAIDQYSEFVKYGDIDSLESAILKWLSLKGTVKKELAKEAKYYYSREKMFNEYEQIYLSSI